MRLFSFDPATLAILERVNHAVSLLESGVHALSPPYPPTFTPMPGSAALNTTPPHDNHSSQSQGEKVSDRSSEMPELPALIMNLESILKWPVFRASSVDTESFVLDAEDLGTTDCTVIYDTSQGGVRNGRGVCEEDFVHLSQRFLAYVHVKNPILDIAEYKTHVSVAAEHGPGWDGASCLVVRRTPPFTVRCHVIRF